MSEKEKSVKIDRNLISEFAGYPTDILYNMLQMSQAFSESHLIDDDRMKHISQIVGDKIQQELISRN